MPRLVPAIDRQTAIHSMQQLTAERGRRVTRPEFVAATGISNFQMIREFGGYNGLLRAAGFAAHLANLRIPDDELLGTLRDACNTLGHVPSQSRFDKMGAGGRYRLYQKRWGRWPQVLAALRCWVEVHDPEFRHRDQLPSVETVPGAAAVPGWAPVPAVQGRRYGAPLDLPCFRHAPVNEAGVMVLFGLLSPRLGFAVESVCGAFPDCEAKRLRGGGIWERCRIEFEFASRNFKIHNHDPAGCDLIVCWEHNWAEAPIEVLELRSSLAR